MIENTFPVKIYHNGIGWNYIVHGVRMTDRCYKTAREAQFAARRAIKRRNEKSKEAK